nr:PREDICTED: cilia- and flagella-associated protein 61-like [Latimeria chalumnae]|eukprot:XP_014350839.1 PREDICTED: cilia- and flagella-associated protein 61-like [Latimeria chalumnae]
MQRKTSNVIFTGEYKNEYHDFPGKMMCQTFPEDHHEWWMVVIATRTVLKMRATFRTMYTWKRTPQKKHMNELPVKAQSKPGRNQAVIKDNKALKWRVETAENQLCTSNVQIIGLPDEAGQENLSGCLEQWVPEAFKLDVVEDPIYFERAFQIPMRPGNNSESHHTIVVSIPTVADRDRILQAAKKLQEVATAGVETSTSFPTIVKSMSEQHFKKNTFNRNAIVYGNTLDVYTTIQTLLHLGVSGSCIHLVHPPSNSNVTCFNNFTIENAIQKAISTLGVAIYYNSILAHWNDGDDPDPITSASFTTDLQPFRLECSVFFNFSMKTVDYEAFKAINDACLVYDGRLVIDSVFHTNDDTIRAAGSLTKFSRYYHADQWSHSNFNSREVGFQLAALMLHHFDPTLDPTPEPPAELSRLIPMYTGAKVQGGLLPGEYHYLHVAKPAVKIPLEAQMTQPNYGREIITGSVESGNYFRLHINSYNMVETITCLSQESFSASNILCLYGQHECLLNKLCTRFDEGLITDFYRHAYYACIENIFWSIKRKKSNMSSPQELAEQLVDGECMTSEDPERYLQEQFERGGYKQLVERSTLNYLNYNSYQLPMYAWPGIL